MEKTNAQEWRNKTFFVNVFVKSDYTYILFVFIKRMSYDNTKMFDDEQPKKNVNRNWEIEEITFLKEVVEEHSKVNPNKRNWEEISISVNETFNNGRSARMC